MRNAGIEGNEVADLLTKKEANTPFIKPKPVFGVEPKFLKCISNEDMIQRVNIYWRSLAGQDPTWKLYQEESRETHRYGQE